VDIKSVEQLRGSCNALSTDQIIKQICELLLTGTSDIRYTVRDTSKFSVLNKALFGERYQSEYLRTGTFPANERIYSESTVFFRVRPLNLEPEEFVIEDFWEPPVDRVNGGRLNKKYEPMLYLSIEDARTAIAEARVKIDGQFMLMIYRSIADIEVTEIGWDFDSRIVKFMTDIFSSHGDAVYSLSNKLAKVIYNFDNDGWCYPSVLRSKGTNFCMNLTSKNKLELIGALKYNKTIEKDELLSIFDLKDTNNIKQYADWGRGSSSAEGLLNKLDKDFKEYLKVNQQAHDQQPIRTPKVKAVIVEAE
jgi:RES domain-containing protein